MSSGIGDLSVGNRGNLSVLSMGNWGNSIGSLGNRGSMSISGDRGGDLSISGLGVGGMMDMGLLNNLLDRVNLVGSRDSNGPGDLNGVGLGNMLGDKDLSLNGNRDIDGDINVVLVDLELRNNVGLDRGDSGVGPKRSKDLLLDNSINWGRSSWDGCGRDSGGIRSNVGDNRGGKSSGLNKVLGSSSSVGGGRLGDNFLSGLDILVSCLNGLGSNLDGLMSYNSILNMVLHNSRSGSIGVLGLSDSNRGMDGSIGSSMDSSIVAGSAIGTGNKGKCDLKKVNL